jgi:hypothetical protein
VYSGHATFADLMVVLDLFDPTFVAQIRQYSHQGVIVDVNVVQYDRMVDVAGFLDELFHQSLFPLVLSVLHSWTGGQML